jgi:2,3-bisphosphoglycerate-dependent phosphoglycerate mutase
MREHRAKLTPMPAFAELILLRHGESVWNRDNRYTGWTDIDLTEKGISEAHQAAELLRPSFSSFDHVYTSVLKRAIRTVWLVLADLDCMWLPVEHDWRLNERHYGALQGLNKADSVNQFGLERIYRWRRTLGERPPLLTRDDVRHPRFDPRYNHHTIQDLPAGESLADTAHRVMYCWNENILPALSSGRRILLVAHGNSLRALVTVLNRIPEQDVPDLVIPTGIPLVYDFDRAMNITGFHFLGCEEKIDEAAENLRRQGMLRRRIL